MKWYHFTVEYFEDLRNVDHCEFLIMRHQENGKFLLETKLRTWSELRRERALASNPSSTGITTTTTEKDEHKLDRSRTFVVTRRWGGCPNGCNHTNHYKKRHDLEALRQKDNELSCSNGTLSARRHRHKSNVSIGDGDDEHEHSDQVVGAPLEKTQSLDDIISSPDGTPSFITAEDRARNLKSPHLHVGRDFGGTYSGHASLAESDSDASSAEARRRHHLSIRSKGHGGRNGDTGDGGKRAYVNRLGDVPPRGDSDVEDLDKAEEEDRSIRGSVY